MAVDISEELHTIETSQVGSEIKQAIWDALYKLDQAGSSKIRPYDISTASEFAWGITDVVDIGIPQEVN